MLGVGKHVFACLNRRNPVRSQHRRTLTERMFLEAVHLTIKRTSRNAHRFGFRHIAGCDNGLEPHPRMRIGNRLLQNPQRILKSSVPAADHPHRVAAKPRVCRSEQLLEQFRLDHFMVFIHPECFVEMVFVIRIARIERRDPRLKCSGHFGRLQSAQQSLGLIAMEADRRGQLATKGRSIHGHKVGNLRQRAVFSSDPPNPTVVLVAIRMTERGLVVADDRVVPIGNINRPIRSDLDIDRTKTAVFAP